MKQKDIFEAVTNIYSESKTPISNQDLYVRMEKNYPLNVSH